jgi:hypothetical protein
MKKLNCSIAACLFVLSALAQYTVPQVISSGGGNGQSGKVSLSWTVSEPVIETGRSGKLTVTQGFQQGKLTIDKKAAAKILDATVVDDPSRDIQAYPNPTDDYVTLKLNVGELIDYTYGIYDLAGQEIFTAPVEQATISTDFSMLPKATYILLVRQREVPVKVFQIIKN